MLITTPPPGWIVVSLGSIAVESSERLEAKVGVGAVEELNMGGRAEMARLRNRGYGQAHE